MRSVSGTGVTIFNAGSKYPHRRAALTAASRLSGNGSYNLTPPTTGTYAGIVIFQSRDNTKALTVSGNASGMTGTIYAPAAQLAESGNAAAQCLDRRRYALDQRQRGCQYGHLELARRAQSLTRPPRFGPPTASTAWRCDGTGQTIAIVDAYDDPSIYPGSRRFRLTVRSDRRPARRSTPSTAGIVVLDGAQPVRPGHVPAINRPEWPRHR